MQHIEPMTIFGYEKLQAELRELRDVRRPQIVKDIEEARAHGDLKENAEYHAAKENQKITDLKIAELSEMLASSQIVNPKELNHSKVSFGSTVLLNDLSDDKEYTYTIVGGCESNPDNGLISFNSPLAKALLGKEEGDEVKITLGSKKREFEIVEVTYKEIVFECH